MVDDSLTVRNIVVKHLANLGFAEVDVAEVGNIALERIREKRYGLLISDWEMRAQYERRRVFEDGPARPEMHENADHHGHRHNDAGTSWLAGANAYLQKPFTDADFEKAVKSVLGSH